MEAMQFVMYEKLLFWLEVMSLTGEVCSESELSNHIGKCLALIFILALSIHLQYFTNSALPQGLARIYR